MSFFFQEFWGVVVRDGNGKLSGVRALGGWDHLITATTAEDIAKTNAELILVDTEERGRAVYIAGDSLRYDELADMIGSHTGKNNDRIVWMTEWLKQQAGKQPQNQLWKYRVVFSENKGLAWPKLGTYGDKRGIHMEGLEEYMKRLGIL